MLRQIVVAARAALAGLFLVWGAGVAHADLAAFNDAVRKGDYKAAAVAAKAAWPTLNKTDADIAVIAREFGFASLIAGDNEAARAYGQFLVESGPTLPTPDANPATSAVLFAAADYRIRKGAEALSALRAAVHGRTSAPGLDMISVLGAELLYISDWNTGDLDDAVVDAGVAAEFLAREPKGFLARQRGAEVTAAAASFLQGRARITKGRNEAYEKMADVHDAIVADLNATDTPAARSAFWSRKWEAEAWASAIGSYLTSSYSQIGSNINTNVELRGLMLPQFGQYPEDPASAGIPLCDGRFAGKTLTYPASKEFSGLVGAVIARLETAPDGKVTNVEILASVPTDAFSAGVERTMKSWTYKPSKSAERTNCRLNSRNNVYKVTFRVG